jgi:glycosyl transferase family 25
VTAGEVGCFLSHVGVMKQFLTSRAEFCLVLEDDALVGPDLPLVMNELIAHRTRWDVAFLYGNHSGLPVKTERLGEVGALVGFFGRQTGTVAYIVNRKAATVYANRLLPMRLPIDHSFDRAWRLDIRIRGVAPFPVKTGGFSSDIGRTGRKFVWYRRISTLLTRTRAESNRAFHYLFRDRIWLEAARHRITRKG